MTSMAKKHRNYARADDAFAAACVAFNDAEADVVEANRAAMVACALRDAARAAFFAARKALTDEVES